MTRNRFRFAVGIAVALACAATVIVVAQPPPGQPPEGPAAGQPPGRRGDGVLGGRFRRGPGGFPPPPGFHLMSALDRNNDGKLSTSEVDDAVNALKKLDKNQDGKLSADEIGWPPQGGFGGPGGRETNQRPQRPASDTVPGRGEKDSAK